MAQELSSVERVSAEELRSYVEAFTASANRSRYALFAVVVATVIVAIANYNFQTWSWPLLRLEAWYQEPASGNGSALRVGAGEATKEDQAHLEALARKFHLGSGERLRIAREEYLRQFAARSVFNASPIPGVSIDYNDLGTLGGIALVLLMLVLAFSLHREHGNLYLSLFKVRLLAAAEGEDARRGDSRANFLYHALAMSQALFAPPTLARWGVTPQHRHWPGRNLLIHFGFVYYLPAAAQTWVFATNVATRRLGESYGASMTLVLGAQLMITIVLWGLSWFAYVNVQAMGQRWARAFFRVNPGRALVFPMTRREWWCGSQRANDDDSRRLVSDLVDNVVSPQAAPEGLVDVDHGFDVKLDHGRIPRAAVREMERELRSKGESAARAWCVRSRAEFDGLATFRQTKNELRLSEWSVAGEWTFRCRAA